MPENLSFRKRAEHIATLKSEIAERQSRLRVLLMAAQRAGELREVLVVSERV